MDGNTSTLWLTTLNNPINQWLRYDLSSATTVAQVAIYPYSAALTRAPKDFKIQGSNNGTDFTDVKSFTNVTGWSAAWRTFDL